jgi:hypothetical protein
VPLAQALPIGSVTMTARLRVLLLTVVTCGAGWLTPAPASAQRAGTPAKDTWTPARTPDGQPDIQGMWQTQGGNLTVSLEAGAVTLLESDRVGFFDPGSARAGGRPIGIVDPPDGKIPLQPWAVARRQEIADNYRDPKGNLGYMDPSARCLGAGVPRLNYVTPYNGYQFIQVPGYVVLFAEWNHEVRIVPLGDRPHLSPEHRFWNGDSRGRWEGTTLVIDVTNFNGKAWFDWLTFHSDALHVVERFTIVDAETIHYEATIDDPKVFTRPWNVAFPFKRGAPEYRLFEYACHEGNRYMRSAMR